MGRYVEFWEGSPAGLPGLVLEHYAQFRAWYLGELLSEFSEDCEPDLLELLRAHPRLTAALPISTPEQARLVDLLVSELVGSFLDRMEGPRLTLIHGPQFHARRYEEIRRWVGQVLVTTCSRPRLMMVASPRWTMGIRSMVSFAGPEGLGTGDDHQVVVRRSKAQA